MRELNNPIRYSIRDATYDIAYLLPNGTEVDKIVVRPSEGNVYLHWREVE